MLKKIIFTCALLCLCSGATHANPSEKIHALRRENRISEQLINIAIHQPTAESTRAQLSKQIEPILAQEHDPDALARAALLCSIYMYPGNAGDESVDKVFDIAWQHIITRIEQIGGNAAITALENIRLQMNADGAFSLQIDGALQKLQQSKNNRSD